MPQIRRDVADAAELAARREPSQPGGVVRARSAATVVKRSDQADYRT
jgi:hypothetical protein